MTESVEQAASVQNGERRELGGGRASAVRIPFVNPRTGKLLERRGSALVDPNTGEQVARISGGVPRFVSDETSYVDSFGWQWNRWESTMSDSRQGANKHSKRKLLMDRTRFDHFAIDGKTILECGMGGGDDTEILLQLPFREVHSFDFSNAVDRAARHLHDPRLSLAQANIFEIPYADRTFDFVFCHRVIQHTHDPHQALRCVARKVKLGGVLFVHSYNASLHFLMAYKYKYRWLTRRMPKPYLAALLDKYAEPMHRVNEGIRTLPKPVRLLARFLAHNFLPLVRLPPDADRPREHALDLVKLITFDSLTPTFDQPMRWSTMRRLVQEEGFEIRFSEHRSTFPLWCTAVRVR